MRFKRLGRMAHTRGNWRRWFAWRPVLCDGGVVVWLEMVERQMVFYYAGEEYHYRMLEVRP